MYDIIIICGTNGKLYLSTLKIYSILIDNKNRFLLYNIYIPIRPKNTTDSVLPINIPSHV